MLQSIREKTQGWFATLILGCISISFALWGISYYLMQDKSSTSVAKVNGLSISTGLFEQTLHRNQQQQQLALGNEYSLQKDFQNQLKIQTLNQLIDTQVLTQGLHKAGLSIASRSLDSLLLNIPAFQENGRFSLDRYKQVLASMSVSPNDFMQDLAQQVMISQAQIGIGGSGFALPQDINAAYALLEQTRDVGFIIVPVNQYTKNFQPSPAEIKAFYEQNSQSFKEPDAVRIEYVLLPAQENQPDVQAQKTEILANVSYENTDSLEPVAQALNLPIQTTEFFTRKGDAKNPLSQNPKILAAAFSDDVLKQKYNSEVISLQDGSQLVLRVKTYQAEKLKDLSAVQNEIIQSLGLQEARRLARQEAEKLSQALAKGQSGADIAQSAQLKWQEKQDVNRHQENVNSKVLQQVFSLPKPKSKNQPSTAVLELANGNYAAIAIYEVVDANPASMTESKRQAFRDRIATAYGQLDYQLYVRSMMKEAKIKRYLSNENEETN